MIGHYGTLTLWKPGTRNTAIEFADCKKLQSQEPETFALLTLQDHFKTSDDRFEYTVYISRFGFSVGRKKKQVSSVSVGEESPEISLTSHTNTIAVIFDRMEKRLENLTNSLDNLIYCLCANTEMGIDKEKIIKQ